MNVKRIANDFKWEHGEKVIVEAPKHLGVKGSVQWAGTKTSERGQVIILEEDIAVSKRYYEFAKLGLQISDNRVAGVSLYSHELAEAHPPYPFVKYPDGNDVYLMQFPVSWGQCWDQKRWAEFEGSRMELGEYLRSKNKYLLCPTISHCSYFGEKGTNFFLPDDPFQVQMMSGEEEFVIPPDLQGIAAYDYAFEMNAELVRRTIPEWNDIDFEVDLYGSKDPATVDKPYMLTTNLPMDLNPEQNILKPALWSRFTAITGKQLPAVLVPTESVRPLGNLSGLRHRVHMHRIFNLKQPFSRVLAYNILRMIGIFKESR